MMLNYKDWNFINKLNLMLLEKQDLMKLWLDIKKAQRIENYKIKKD